MKHEWYEDKSVHEADSEVWLAKCKNCPNTYKFIRTSAFSSINGPILDVVAKAASTVNDECENESETAPWSWKFNRQLKWSVLNYVFKVLGRIDDTDGELMKIRQSILRIMAKVQGDSVMDDCPLQKAILDAMVPIMWHHSHKVTVSQ